MGSHDDKVEVQSRLNFPSEKNQGEVVSGDFQMNEDELEEGSVKEPKCLKEIVLNDDAIGEESHIVDQAIGHHHNETENEKIDLSQSTERSGVDHVEDIDSIHLNDVGVEGKVEGQDLNSQSDSSLTGTFFVVNVDEEENDDDSHDDKVTQSLDKTLTLAVCSPKPITENHESDESNVPTSRTTAIKTEIDPASEQSDKNYDTETRTNRDENSPRVEALTNSDDFQTQANDEINNAIKAQPTKQDGISNIGINNDGDAKSHVSLLNQATGQHRTNTKRHKKHSRLQDTVSENDETGDVLESVVRANQVPCQHRDEPIKPKTSAKRQHKSSMGCKQSTKDTLHFQLSQTKNSSSNGRESNLTTSKLTHQGVSRLRLSDSDGEFPLMNKGGPLQSFLATIPNEYENHSRQPKLYPRMSADGTFSSLRKGGFTSIFERKYTKRELQRALPRKSFFNCHEKAMKDAGLQVEDSASKRKAERLKAKLERIAREFDPLPSKVVPKVMNEHLEQNPSDERGEISILVTDVQDEAFDSMADKDTTAENEHAGVISEDAIDLKINTDKSIHSTGKKKRLHPEKSDYIECKPLVHYLEYVRDNQVEYENHLHTSHQSIKDKPINRLISMGKAFELRHQGGVNRPKGNDIIVMAAKALRPRSSDFSRYYKQDNDKSGHRGQDPTHRQARPPSDDKRRQERNSSAGNVSKDDEHHAKTELEKKKFKAEEWAMSVSTNTLTRAKIQSLRELGADDEELTKWWVALRKCHYLRTNGFISELM